MQKAKQPSFIFHKEIPGVEIKYQAELSAQFLKNFGKPYYNAEKVKQMFAFALKYYASKFAEVHRRMAYLQFHKRIYLLHEVSVSIKTSGKINELYDDKITLEYFSIYRRVLKMILEQGCTITLLKNDLDPADFEEKFENTLAELIVLGRQVYMFSAGYAEQQLIEDPNDISFDANGLYILNRRHHYNHAFDQILDFSIWPVNNWVIDKKGEEDFDNIIQEVFGFKYSDFNAMIATLYHHNKWEPIDVAIFEKEHFYKICEDYLEVPENTVKSFLSGFLLSKSNKILLEKLATHPHTFERFLHLPMVEWKFENKNYLTFGMFSLFESYSELIYNAIPWNKAPKEWLKIPAFKKYCETKALQHDKWLDDMVEEKIKPLGVIYDRTVVTLQTRERGIKIDNDKCGEIDFLVINQNTKKIFIVECKHLVGRNDMPNWRQDHSNFTKGSTNFNKTLQRKLKFMGARLPQIEEHFRLIQKDDSINLTDFKLEGIFVINTPTFYMYNSDLRIYVYHDIDKVIAGKYVDKTYDLLTAEDDRDSIIMVKYPYFRRKKMFFYNDPDDGLPVDKYGFPIKPGGNK